LCHEWEEEKFLQDYWVDLKERDYMEGMDIDGRVILKSIFKK
jgi:hypothetical protein